MGKHDRDRKRKHHDSKYDRDDDSQYRKAERKKEKELAKLLETPEEKRARRLAKKARKHGSDADGTIMGYTNESNPFGDANLTEKFVWKKKVEQDRRTGGVASAAEERRRKDELRQEIEKARQRREQRDAEKAMWEAEKERMAREAENAEYEGWEDKEADFHLEQAKVRADLRIKGGRAKPVDALAGSLIVDDLSVPVEINEPYRVVEHRTVEELEDIRHDIQTRQALGDNIEFWDALAVVCDDTLSRLKRAVDTDVGVHGTVRSDVETVLAGKGRKELEELEVNINQKLESGDALDAEYWETLLHQLKIHKAKAVLDEIHQEKLKERLMALEAARDTAKLEKESDEEEGRGATVTTSATAAVPAESGKAEQSEEGAASSAWNALKNEALKQMGHESTDEPTFDDRQVLDKEVYKWQDKYRPRAPRYINRVTTGFEWNKYNVSHYDYDNPPPRIVQGYKFNIFYPDLIDTARPPRYFIESLPDTMDFVTLRFTAGPPYEDIAFKVINREWEYGHKRGFRSEFRNGILHLYFNFKRYRYRR